MGNRELIFKYPPIKKNSFKKCLKKNMKRLVPINLFFSY